MDGPSVRGDQLDVASVGPVVNRLKRAQGQPAGVTRMLEQCSDCRDVVIRLSAVSKALDRAGFAIIATGMEKCLCDEGGAMDREDLEKLFLTPAGARLPRGVGRLVCADETARLVAPLPGAAPRSGAGRLTAGAPRRAVATVTVFAVRTIADAQPSERRDAQCVARAVGGKRGRKRGWTARAEPEVLGRGDGCAEEGGGRELQRRAAAQRWGPRCSTRRTCEYPLPNFCEISCYY
ncbi:hypothetical protein FM106_04810 [Brachybacterium faecium]|nr:hypothetical protein FM106_04810 [Brachybacterium faecium]